MLAVEWRLTQMATLRMTFLCIKWRVARWADTERYLAEVLRRERCVVKRNKLVLKRTNKSGRVRYGKHSRVTLLTSLTKPRLEFLYPSISIVLGFQRKLVASDACV